MSCEYFLAREVLPRALRSTTGQSHDNSVCSPYSISWHVDKDCHQVCSLPSYKMLQAVLGRHPSAPVGSYRIRRFQAVLWVSPEESSICVAACLDFLERCLSASQLHVTFLRKQVSPESFDNLCKQMKETYNMEARIAM